VEAVAAIDRQILQRVWKELDYRIDICCVTKGGISNPCKVGQKLGVSLSSVDMLSFGVTIQATVPQMSEIPEELMYYPVFNCLSHI
jgi:hypothetical protein